MSRHRNVRSMNYTDEYDGYDDVYGHSLDDDYCISPSDAAFIYDRDGTRGQQKMGAFLKSDEDIAEEDETDIDKLSELDDIEKAKLNSCIEKIKSVIGDLVISETEITSLILKHNFEVEKVIDIILTSSKPQIILKEKDVNKDNKTFSSLSDLISQNNSNNFTNFNSKIKEQLFNNAMGGGGGGGAAPVRKFVVPKLFDDASPNFPLFSEKPAQNSTTSHTSLSSLVSSHLGTQTQKLGKPDFSQNKLNENFTKINLNDAENDWHIDLSNALRNSTSAVLNKTKMRCVENEVIFPKNFLPPILPTNTTTSAKKEAPKILCQFDISHMMKRNDNLETNVSRFGKIICRKYRYRSPAYFPKSDNARLDDCYAFNEPSPDDLILKFLRRK